MKNFKIITTSIYTIMFLFLVDSLQAQVSRSTGMGVRAGYWDGISTSEVGIGEVSTASGVGELYFFSRLKDNWFLEASIGGVAKADVSGPQAKVESSTMTPLLFGARYDLLSAEYNSILQPYLSFGAGVFFSNKSTVHYGVTSENKTEPGIFAGTGVNILLSSRFAVNADFKYHAINTKKSTDIDYSGYKLSIGLAYMWGSTPEIFRVEEVKLIVQDIYPAYYQFYNTYPIALAVVKNTTTYPIEVNVHSEIKEYSERSQESGFIKIEPGKSIDIPIQALFGEKLLESTQRNPAVIDLEIEARAGSLLKKNMSLNVTVHSRNAWNGEIDRLGFFITADEKEIMQYSRNVVNGIREQADVAKNITIARALFDDLQALGIVYQSDPNIPYYQDDYVQFAGETLKLRSGDCDDLVVLFTSLLESVGIKTAFIDVQDPSAQEAHLYLIFDTGVSIENSQLVSTNEKRYIIRKGSAGNQTVWIPVETTLINKGFDAAWNAGAMDYLQKGIIRSGLNNGWIRIVSVH
jgi:transglutaminase-like putative cysteine protease/outer membrane protein W